MVNTIDSLLLEAFDTLLDSVCIIDRNGDILFVNKSWINFGCSNGLQLTREGWKGINYISVCKNALQSDSDSKAVYEGMTNVLSSRCECFEYEYPCHSPDDQRWFSVSIKAMTYQHNKYLVISHHNITRRKIAEDEIRRLAQIDPLTGTVTRSAFEELIRSSWKKSEQMKSELCICMIDIDDFKSINDTHGHVFGDDCLKSLGKIFRACSAMASGVTFARYGGEEFVAFSHLSLSEMHQLMEKLQSMLTQMVVKNEVENTGTTLTISIGIVAIQPNRVGSVRHAIDIADNLLYQAKREGKNRIKVGNCLDFC